MVNTFGDLRGTFAAVERINSVLSGVQVDDALAYGLERELKQKAVNDENYKLFFSNGSADKNQTNYSHYMSALKTSSNLLSLAWSGDICLEGIAIAILLSLMLCCFCVTFVYQQPCLLINVLLMGASSHEMNFQSFITTSIKFILRDFDCALIALCLSVCSNHTSQ